MEKQQLDAKLDAQLGHLLDLIDNSNPEKENTPEEKNSFIQDGMRFKEIMKQPNIEISEESIDLLCLQFAERYKARRKAVK